MKSLKIFIFISIFLTLLLSNISCGILDAEYATFDLAVYSQVSDTVIVIVDGEHLFPSLKGVDYHKYEINSSKEVDRDRNYESIRVSIAAQKFHNEGMSEVKTITLKTDRVSSVVFEEDDWE